MQEAIVEHYRARNAANGDTLTDSVVRRQTEVRRDLASAWVTLRETRHAPGSAPHDTSATEHLLLRRTPEGWVVLAATRVNGP
ncbi:MAG TPA: hypothetical protein VFI13_13455 [Gemmatimonadales bacterium]|nr:hypothetical protein [Gemmatimonadales bacterium]